MTRPQFFKSLLAIILSPKILGEIGKEGEPEYKWSTGNRIRLVYKDGEKSVLPQEKLWEQKISDLVSKKPPNGYAVNLDAVRKHKWFECYQKSKDTKFLELLRKEFPNDVFKLNHLS